MKAAFWIVALYFLSGVEAFAYIGPGIGAGTIAVVMGIVGSIFLLLFAILFYPLRRMFRRRRLKNDEASVSTQSSK